MAFNAAIGDVIAVGKLAWTLYRDCYQVARDAPQDFQLLVQEVSTMSNSLALLQEEVKDPESVIFQSGEERVQMVKNMVENIHDTLLSLQKYATKYEIAGAKTASKLAFRQKVRNFKWSVHRKSIEGLRSKLHQHNGILTLLLTSAGNSSLQRIQSSTNALENDVRVIREYVSSQQGGQDILIPSLSIVDDDLLRSSISADLLKHAEVIQPWTTIGVVQWIDTGRWWLQGCELELYALRDPGTILPISVYASLIKASWILVDIIACHPQVTFLSAKIRAEITALCVSIKRDFQRIDEFKLVAPSLSQLKDQDLHIWESHFQAPVLQRNHESLGESKVFGTYWAVVGDEVALFVQRAACQMHARATSIICDVLFIIHKNAGGARLVANDQAQRAAMDLDTTNRLDINMRPESVVVNDCEIFLKRTKDVELLAALIETANFYFHERQQTHNSIDAFRAFLFLIIVKNRYSILPTSDALQEIQSQQWDDDAFASSLTSTASHIVSEAEADKLNQRLFDGKEHDRSKICQVSWAIQVGQEELLTLLLKEHATYIKDPEHDLSALMMAAYCGHESVARVLVADATAKKTIKQDLARKNRHGWSALHYACSHGDEKVARLFLRSKADINLRGHGDATPLFCAAMHNLDKQIQLLLDKGADTEKADKGGITPLLNACYRKNEKAIELFLNEDVNVLAVDNFGTSALHFSLHWGRRPVSKPLFDRLFSKYWEEDSLGMKSSFEKTETVNLNVFSDWGALFLDSRNARFEYPEGRPSHIEDVYQRAIIVRRPADVKTQFFHVHFRFQVIHKHIALAFSTAHGTLAEKGRGRITLEIEQGGGFETTPTGEGRNFRRHKDVYIGLNVPEKHADNRGFRTNK